MFGAKPQPKLLIVSRINSLYIQTYLLKFDITRSYGSWHSRIKSIFHTHTDLIIGSIIRCNPKQTIILASRKAFLSARSKNSPSEYFYYYFVLTK